LYLYSGGCGARAATAADVRLQDIVEVIYKPKKDVYSVVVKILQCFKS